MCISPPSALAVSPAQPYQTLHQMYHESWTTRDGVPTSIEDLMEGPDGFIWIATDNGVYRFDGVSFERLGVTLPSNSVRAIKKTRDGSVWLWYFFGGLSRIKNEHIANYTVRDGLQDHLGFDIIQRSDDSFWITGSSGLQVLKDLPGGGVSISDLMAVPGLVTAIEDTEGNLWLSTDHQLLVLPQGQSAQPIVVSPVTGGQLVCGRGKEPGLWCGHFMNRGPVVHWVWRDGGAVSQTLVNDVEIRNVAAPGDGTTWIVLDQGLKRSLPASVGQSYGQLGLEEFSKRDGLSGTGAFDITTDREGSVWIATSKGLDRFRVVPFSAVDIGEGIPVQLLHGTPGPSVIVATDHLIDVTSGKAVPISASFDKAWSRSLYRAHDQTLWIGSLGSLFQFANNTLSGHDLPSGVGLHDPVLAICEDEAHRLWISVGNSKGIFRLDGATWIPQGDIGALRKDSPLFIERDHTNSLWFGFRNDHLARLSAGQVREFGVSDGLNLGNLKAFAEHGNRVWVGGEDGVATFIGDRFYPLVVDSTSLHGVTGLAFAPDGSLWINGLDGVFRVAGEELDLDSIAGGHVAKSRLFDRRDGLQGVPHSTVGLGSVFVADNGKVYVGTREFLQSIDPLNVSHNVLPPAVLIKGITVDGERAGPLQHLTLRPRVEAVQIDYTAASLLVPDRVSFRYQLEGYDRTWVDAGSRRQAFYSRLPPANYVFRVIAANDSGVWNNTGASISFTVPPAFVQTLGFKVMCVLIFSTGASLLYRIRVMQLSRQFKARMYTRLAERERIARELHDTFFQAIQGLLLIIHNAAQQMRPDDPIRPRFEDALAKSDKVMAEGRGLVLDLRVRDRGGEDLSTLLNRTAQDLLSVSRATFRLLVLGEARPLRPAAFDEIYWLGREALSNAFRHSGAEAIEVELNYDLTEFRARFRDNGSGIDTDILNRGQRENHWGLPGMRERASKIGAQMDIWSARSAGTEIEIRIPAALAYDNPGTTERLRWLRTLFRNVSSAHDQ